jgi:hypothetical protein
VGFREAGRLVQINFSSDDVAHRHGLAGRSSPAAVESSDVEPRVTGDGATDGTPGGTSKNY